MARRRMFFGGAIAGIGALAAGMRPASAQPTTGPAGIEWLDYSPPRRYAAGARVGNIVYLAGEVGSDLATGKVVAGGIGPQAEKAFENIRHNLKLLGSDAQYIFKITTFLVNISDISTFAQTRAKFLCPAARVIEKRRDRSLGRTRSSPSAGLLRSSCSPIRRARS